jgi:cell division protein FtsQ
VVTGISRTRYQEHREDVEAQLRELIALAQDYEGRKLSSRGKLEELSIDEDDDVTLYVGKNLVAVRLGEPPFAEKLDRLAALWNEFDRRGIQAQVIHLDNRSRPGWVAVKLADATPAPPSSSPPTPPGKPLKR